MNIPEMIKRGPGRPPKQILTAVGEALAAPLPEGVTDALAKAEAAWDSLRRAEQIGSQVRERDSLEALDRRARAAQTALQRALAAQDVARQMGEDGPSEDDIAELRSAAEVAKTARDTVAVRDEAYSAEIHKRGLALRDAQEHLDLVLAPWTGALLDAADHQVAKAATLLSEALLAAKALNQWFARDTDVKFFGLKNEDHRGPESLPMDSSLRELLARRTFLSNRASRFAIEDMRADRRPADTAPNATQAPGRWDRRSEIAA